MRLEVIADGQSLERHEFHCKPSQGEIIQLKSGRYVVDGICHNIEAGRLQAICSAETKDARRTSPRQSVQS